MTTINRAVIRIEIEDYVSAIQNNYGYIDGSDYFLVPAEDRVVSVCETVEEAEAEIDQTIYLTITENEAVLEYEYIPESEKIYFNTVDFMGKVYDVESDMYSEPCHEAIKEYLKSVYLE